MSKYLKQNKIPASSALKRAQRNIYWQAGLALTTIVLTIVILFAMTSAWYTNIVQTSGLTFQAEAWGFDGEIVVNSEAIQAAPGDEGVIHLEVANGSEAIAAVSVGALKTGMTEFPMMQKRLYVYVDTQLIRNGETMDRVYLNSLDSYTYTLFGNGRLTLTEDTHTDAQLKWQWVYDVLGYYVLCSRSGSTITEMEYLRPVEYDFDAATFTQPGEDGVVSIELKTVDGKTTVEEFLQSLSEKDGYQEDIDYRNPVSGYYPVEVDENGYGVYVYLYNYTQIQDATAEDTALGQAAASNPPEAMPSYPVQLTVSAQKNDENIFTVSSLAGLNTAMDLMSGTVVQLSDDIRLGANEKILVPTGTQIIVDLNGHTITSESSGNAIQAEPGSYITFTNGKLSGGTAGTGIYAVGAEVTLHQVDINGFVDGIYVADNAQNNTMDSRVRVVNCNLSTHDCAVYVSGNGKASQQKSQVVIENSVLRSDNVVIYGNGDSSGNGRWGTDIQIIDSQIIANPNKVTTGIYHPQQNSTLTIYNSTVSGWTGVAIKGGTVSVRGSDITGKGDEVVDAPAAGNSGCADTGDGIYIENNYGYMISLEITGITLTAEDGTTTYKTSKLDSANNKSLRLYSMDDHNVTIKIYNGMFKQAQPEAFLAGGATQQYTEGADFPYAVTMPQ